MTGTPHHGGSTSGIETVLRWIIPGLGLALAALFGAMAWWISPVDGAQGFHRMAEIAGTFLSLATTLFSVAIVSFLISEYWRRLDRRRALEERHREQREADSTERQRLVGELRDVHHSVKTAQLRLRAHKTVRAYGNEIRDAVMPAIAQLGGVRSDINARCGGLFDEESATQIVEHVAAVVKYLAKLSEEFEDKYLAASLLQEASYAWRQHRVAELVKKNTSSVTAPTFADLPEKGESDVWRSHLMYQEENGSYRFPRLAIFVADAGGHEEGFSKPVWLAMNEIERSRRPGRE